MKYSVIHDLEKFTTYTHWRQTRALNAAERPVIVRWLCGDEKRLASVRRSFVQVESEYAAGRPHSRAVGALVGSETYAVVHNMPHAQTYPLFFPQHHETSLLGSCETGWHHPIAHTMKRIIKCMRKPSKTKP